MSFKYFQEKIKEKRKKSPFKDFIMEIGSWSTFTFQKNNNIISKFPKTERIKGVISAKDFQNIRDGLTKNGKEYNEKKSFFEQFGELFKEIEIFSLIDYGGNENALYSDATLNSKNIYMCAGIINNCENILYSLSIKDNCTNVMNSIAVWTNSENIYQSVSVLSSYKVFYSKFINNSKKIYFSSNLNGCSECIFCDNLDNVSYYIKNKPYAKEEYQEKKKEILKEKENFGLWYKSLPKIGKNINSSNVKGSAIMNSENVENGYFAYNQKNGRNLILVGGIDGDENMVDVIFGGSPSANNLYGIMGANGNNLFNCMNIAGSSNIYYSYYLNECSHCIGCIGLQNKSYCILNKEYSKEDWEQLAIKIFTSMEEDGSLSKFFPGNINPFYFNDTLGYLLGNFSKEEVIEKGYLWREKKIKIDIPEGLEIVDSNILNNYEGFDKNNNWYINPEIIKKVIRDKDGNYYRITKQEYNFLLRYALPLPELHWMDRIKINFGF